MSDVDAPPRNTPLVKAIRSAYASGQEDEALEPMIVVDAGGRPVGRFGKGDSVIFYDIRGEREIQLTESLTDGSFGHFPVIPDLDLRFVTMIEYKSSLNVRVAFPPEGKLRNTLCEVVSREGLEVLKIAESEKAIHIGYFMNGKNERPFAGEKKLIVPSPQDVGSYADVPELSVEAVADAIIDGAAETRFRLIVANLANVDVVGHVEDDRAAIRAVEAVDRELGRIVQACRSNGVTLVLTADHGTVEEWLYPDGTINTGHTQSQVPFILADFSESGTGAAGLRVRGELIDVAPTCLELLGLDIPLEMTGRSLREPADREKPGRRRVLLLILDGWGQREEEAGNLIRKADTPHFDSLWSGFPHGQLQASGMAVGMPEGTVGNSEAGHLHIGAGRRVFLDRVRIDRSITDGSFFDNEGFLWAMDHARDGDRPLHLLGIVSHYSSHGTIDHLFALLKMARERGLKRVFVHALIGRRGERPESGALYIDKVARECEALDLGQVVTVMGRFWALDREENWDRVEKTYRALVHGEGTAVGTF